MSRVGQLNGQELRVKKPRIEKAIAEARSMRFCGPSDDPDEITSVTSGFRYLVIQIQRLAGPFLPPEVASQLNAINVLIDDLHSTYDARAELDALLPDIESFLHRAVEEAANVEDIVVARPLPVPVCSIVGDALGRVVYNHQALDDLFRDAGATGETPSGSCVAKCQNWLKRLHNEVRDPLAALGKLIEELMEVDRSDRLEAQIEGRRRINEVLARFNLAYRPGGIVAGASAALPTISLKQILRDRDLAAVGKEFERALQNVVSDPPAAITAACSILESLFRVYIEDNRLDLPGEQSLKPLWKIASKHIGLDPSSIEDDDIRKILSGLNSIVDGIGSLRTHAGSAHGKGRRPYKIHARHARLAIHSSHTLVGFFLETWDHRRDHVTKSSA